MITFEAQRLLEGLARSFLNFVALAVVLQLEDEQCVQVRHDALVSELLKNGGACKR